MGIRQRFVPDDDNRDGGYWEDYDDGLDELGRTILRPGDQGYASPDQGGDSSGRNPGTGVSDVVTRNADGSTTTVHTDPDGTETTTTTGADGKVVGDPKTDSSKSTSPLTKVGNWLETPAGKKIGIAGLSLLLGDKLPGALGFGTSGNANAAGFKGIPADLTATRTQIAQPAYTPYSGQAVMGRKQLSDVAYTPTATTTAPAPSAGYSAVAPPAAALYTPPPAANAPPPAANAPPALTRQQVFDQKMAGQYAPAPGMKTVMPVTQGATSAAQGGLMGLAHGGRYLQGHTDGMADKINTDIDGKQAAKLSHGEFVIPADVVSHLGNGNSDAGATVLYKMMDQVRKARTGNPKQGKQINPAKFMPGGLASLPAYAGGGAIAFDAGDIVATPPQTKETNLSSWAGPVVSGMVAKSAALANAPYQAYTGPLTAGTSPLQTQAFNTASNLQTPASIGQAATTAGNVASEMGGLGYNPVGSDFNAAAAQKYMNPYLQASLDPQIAEARRQSQISQMGNAAQATKAGAFGGSRGALMDTETQRNLGTNLANITGQGYNTAYNNAQQQFNTDQTRRIGENQFGTNFGLQALQGQLGAAQTQGQLGSMQNQTGLANLSAQSAAGATQRGIEQEGVTALKNQFEEERQDPYTKQQFLQKQLQGLPISTQTTSTAQTGLQSLAGGMNELDTLIKKLFP